MERLVKMNESQIGLFKDLFIGPHRAYITQRKSNAFWYSILAQNPRVRVKKTIYLDGQIFTYYYIFQKGDKYWSAETEFREALDMKDHLGW
jgi:hypothetical protein